MLKFDRKPVAILYKEEKVHFKPHKNKVETKSTSVEIVETSMQKRKRFKSARNVEKKSRKISWKPTTSGSIIITN